MSPTPRTLKYAETLQAAIQRIVDAVPELIDALIGRAEAGHLKAAAYLCDRILGRAAGVKIAPADDREPPYTEAAFEADEQEREEEDDIRGAFSRFGARRGAQYNGARLSKRPTLPVSIRPRRSATTDRPTQPGP